MPGGDRVVGLDLEVEDRSGIQVQTVAISLGRVSWPLLVSVANMVASLRISNLPYILCR
jgi:hypothetical protein